ncbi:Gfo/Idh/MocA family oxidoreductase [Candidatus Poribacteria bacterium]|nr:Gfo/Idh/MocA family oxidoreductase [Candidatus Poribacteria bacterium]
MLKAAFIGAGGRSQGAHYPNVHRLPDVKVEAVCELDEARMKSVVERYGIPRQFTDHRKLLDEVELDIVYCVMNERWLIQPALDCLNAGKHIFIEKPPGKTSDETWAMKEAAEANGVYCMVGYQRRYSAVTREAMRLVAERGPATLAVGEFHKLISRSDGETTTLWNDVCHVVDLVRYMAQSEVTEVTAYQDCHNADWRNCYTGMIRFANNCTGIVLGNRSSGGRVLRSELHGYGVGCYMRIPEQIEILADNQPPRVVSGATLGGGEPNDGDRYEGVLTMHEHFVECVREGKTPISDIRDVVHTSDLVDRLEGIGPKR